VVSPSRHALVSELAGHSRLLEVGIGDRLGAARALADRGCDVVAIDVAVDSTAATPPPANSALTQTTPIRATPRTRPPPPAVTARSSSATATCSRSPAPPTR
jgi:Uncharacterized protein conserved in archaea